MGGQGVVMGAQGGLSNAEGEEAGEEVPDEEG